MYEMLPTAFNSVAANNRGAPRNVTGGYATVFSQRIAVGKNNKYKKFTYPLLPCEGSYHAVNNLYVFVYPSSESATRPFQNHYRSPRKDLRRDAI